MATVEYEEVSDWGSLATTVDDYFKHFNNYVFRGQADAVWKLESTLTRAFKKHYPNAGATRDLEEKHLHQFRENIRGRSSLDLAKTSKDELWALGQHFGLYTPLLDWTRSPY